MSRIQETIKTAALTVGFIVDRKSYLVGQVDTPVSELSKYSITIQGGTNVGTHTFNNEAGDMGVNDSYFVPVYDSEKVLSSGATSVPAADTTITKFTPVILGATDKIYPTQCQWRFGDQSTKERMTFNSADHSLYNDPKFMLSTTLSLSNSISSSGSAPTTIQVTSSANLGKWNSRGSFKIADEIFTYEGIASDTLLGVRVGQYGTTRSNHSAGSTLTLTSGGFRSEDHKYTLGGPQGTNTIYNVEFIIADNYNRKYVVSRMVYPKVGS